MEQGFLARIEMYLTRVNRGVRPIGVRSSAVAELDVIRVSNRGPVTEFHLLSDLRELGLEVGETLLVHSSLSCLGWVVGGPVSVVRALLEAVGSTGALVMPTHSGDLSDPAEWSNPPVDETWWNTIRETMPPFDSALTPTRGMGAVVECFRRLPGATRSCHPHSSFAAYGPLAERITSNHRLESSLGEGSPLARLYELDARVLLLGVGHESNTSLHLAEYRANYAAKKLVTRGAPGPRAESWLEFEDLDLNSDDFEALGADFELEGHVQVSNVGYGKAKLMSQRQLVDFAVSWLESH